MNKLRVSKKGSQYITEKDIALHHLVVKFCETTSRALKCRYSYLIIKSRFRNPTTSKKGILETIAAA